MPLENPNAKRNAELTDYSSIVGRGNSFDETPRTVGVHPALAAPYGEQASYRLSDISRERSRLRKTVDEITAAQRKLSPRFPTIAEALEKRRQARETIAARTLLAIVPFGVIVSVWNSFGWIMAGVGFVGFIVTCFVAGTRQTKRSEGGCHDYRPF